MDASSLLPVPDTLPAPWPIFEVLDLLLFTIHILLVNVVFGGALLLLTRGYRTAKDNHLLTESVGKKLPTIFAFAVTIGVAPLLFIQVVYGHLFYSSSVMMAWWWLLIVPLLILVYYGLYIKVRQQGKRPALAQFALVVSVLGLMYIGLMYTNNFTMMMQPTTWEAFFQNRTGTHLNFADATLLPRYLHFFVASIAVGGLFLAFITNLRKGDEAQIRSGLSIFAYATIVQMVIGLWWLIALPREMMLEFMGDSMLRTILLLLGILLAIGALVTALRNKLRPTIYMFLLLLLTMTVMRALLRASYLRGIFSPGDMSLTPQYGVFVLFLVILIVGLGVIYWMVKAVRAAHTGGNAQ